MQWQEQHLHIGAHLQDQVSNHLAIWHLMELPLEEVPGIGKICLAD